MIREEATPKVDNIPEAPWCRSGTILQQKDERAARFATESGTMNPLAHRDGKDAELTEKLQEWNSAR